MKKILLIVLLFFIKQVNAQTCSVNIFGGSDTICAGNSTMLIANGSTNYTWTIDSIFSQGSNGYVWTAPVLVSTSSVTTLSPTVTTKYLVTGTTGTCTSTQTISIVVNPNPTITAISPSICPYYGSANIIANGALNYSWTPTTGIVASSTNSATITCNTFSINYTVTGTDTNGCHSSTTASVTVYPNIPSATVIMHPGCVGQSESFAYIQSPYNILQCTNCDASVTLRNDTIGGIISSNTSYTISITDTNGCSNYLMGVILANPLPTIKATGDTVCSGQTINLSATGGLYYEWIGNYTSVAQNPSIPNADTSMSGNYYVIGYDTNSCFNSDSTHVLVKPNPIVSYILQKDTTQASTWDAFPTFSSQVTNSIWYWGDSTSTSGFYPSHTYTIAGNYNICVTAFSSCGDSVNYCQNDSIYRLAYNTNSNMVYVNVINGTALTDIKTISTAKQLNIYPNPASNKITVDAKDITEIKLFDVLGKQITITKENQIDVSSLINGVYFIQVRTKQNSYTQKIIVQH